MSVLSHVCGTTPVSKVRGCFTLIQFNFLLFLFQREPENYQHWFNGDCELVLILLRLHGVHNFKIHFMLLNGCVCVCVFFAFVVKGCVCFK